MRLQIRTIPDNAYFDFGSDSFRAEATPNILEVVGSEGEEVAWGIELGAGRLPPGTYLVLAFATDRAGRKSGAVLARITVVISP